MRKYFLPLLFVIPACSDFDSSRVVGLGDVAPSLATAPKLKKIPPPPCQLDYSSPTTVGRSQVGIEAPCQVYRVNITIGSGKTLRVEQFFVATRDSGVIYKLDKAQTSKKIRIMIRGNSLIGDGGFNHGHTWHLDPKTVTAPGVIAGLCNATPRDVQRDVAVLRSGKSYCFGNVQVVARIRERAASR